MKVAIGIQARLGSTRLPRKVLADIGGWTALEHTYLRAAATGAETWVLIPHADDELVAFCRAKGMRNFQVGRTCAEDDVVGRYMRWAAAKRPDLIVRVTADCPFLNEGEVHRVIGVAVTVRSPCTNAYPRQVPDGWDVEALTYDQLRALDNAARGADREHLFTHWLRSSERVTTWPEVDAGAFWRWTLDTPEDLWWFREVASEIDVTPPLHPTYPELVELMERRPDLKAHAWQGALA